MDIDFDRIYVPHIIFTLMDYNIDSGQDIEVVFFSIDPNKKIPKKLEIIPFS